MKGKKIPEEPANIAASVKARRNPVVTDVQDLDFYQITSEVFGEINSGPNAPVQTTDILASKDSTMDKKAKVINKGAWLPEEKIAFFTALKNYGKNFCEISRFIRGRSNRVNQKDLGKSKEQVRVFYIRTYNNIKSFLKFPSELPSFVQELYALINYGVFRTRVKKKLNSRLGDKLNELVTKGSTVIKLNGKRITLRTPVCTALKRLNNINAPEQEYTIPDDIVIELTPRNNLTAWRVQQVYQNPKIRMKVAVNRQLSDIIQLINQKFRSSAQYIRESLSLPLLDTPKLQLSLTEDTNLLKEISIREILKPRFDSVTLKTYCNNITKNTSITEKEDENDDIYAVKMNFYEMERKLFNGIGYEEARNIKLLSLYIVCGCPEVIRLTYEYMFQSDVDMTKNCVTNGLRRLIHLSKNDYLNNLQNKDIKSQLERQLEEMKAKHSKLLEEVKELESQREALDPLASTSPNKSPIDLDQKNPIVYKKQHEVMQQFIDDLPNKNQVVVKQVEYNSSVNSMKQFNKNRRKQKTTLKKPALLVKMPFSIASQQSVDPSIQCSSVITNENGSLYSSNTQQTSTNYLYNNSQSIAESSNENNNQISLLPRTATGMSDSFNCQSSSIADMQPNENTNDSLHSFLNSITMPPAFPTSTFQNSQFPMDQHDNELEALLGEQSDITHYDNQVMMDWLDVLTDTSIPALPIQPNPIVATTAPTTTPIMTTTNKSASPNCNERYHNYFQNARSDDSNDSISINQLLQLI